MTLTMSTDHPRTAILEDVLAQLQSQITDLQTLLPLLCFPLAKVNLLPPPFRRFNLLPDGDVTLDITKVFPRLQRTLLETIIPTWEKTLDEEDCSALTLQYFCPDAFSNASSTAGNVALCAYSTILSLPLRHHCVDILVKLTKQYPVDRLFQAVRSIHDPVKRSVTWDDCLRNIFAVPSKVANAFHGQQIQAELGMPDCYNNLSVRTELLIYMQSMRSDSDDLLLLSPLFSKLVNVGAFPATSRLSPSQTSFFHSTLPVIRRRLANREIKEYQKLWNRIMASLPSLLLQQAIFTSLCSSLTVLEPPLSTSARDRGIVRREAAFLSNFVGNIGPNDDLWNTFTSVIITRTWSEAHSRVFICWLASSENSSEALNSLLSFVADVWSASEHIKHSLLSRHQYISTLLLLIITHFPQSSAELTSIARSPSIISAVGAYISHLDASVRRCGMLVAEVVASRVGKNLDFGDWEGDGEGRLWARHIKQLCARRDIDFEPTSDEEEPERDQLMSTENVSAEVITGTVTLEGIIPKTRVRIQGDAGYDSDDSLTGYASPSSSRSPSPTPSDLEEIEKDPTLRVSKKRVPRPVYLAQLGELVRGAGMESPQENQEADRMEMALNVGEELIRRKRDYGTELAENAANLVYGFASLNDQYDLEDFDNKRQRIIIALVTCCPQIVAGCIIEEFFKNQYSSDQRLVMLNALALGARELASLPIYSEALQPPNPARTTFPSKMLPPVLHQQYLAARARNPLQPLVEGITKGAIDKSQEAGVDKVPEIVRERQLRIRRPAKVTDVSGTRETVVSLSQQPPGTVPFTNLAAEFFIIPFINRFWSFLRDEQVREERTARRDVLHQYRGAGTGLILNPLILSTFLNTMSILVHASQNAPQWLALIAPDTLELAVTLGSKQITEPVEDDFDDHGATIGKRGKEASLLTSALNLTLVILDGCLELDGGHSLGLEHAALLMSAREWAGQVFSLLEQGIRVAGVGGTHETELQRVTAGVLLKVDQITSQWRRSMVNIT